MNRLRENFVVAFAVATAFATGCSTGADSPQQRDELSSDARAYLHNATFRRQTLEESLVNKSNGYSELRLAKYKDDAWGALPEWNPPVRAITAADIGTSNAPRVVDSAGDSTFQTLDIDVAEDEASLIELGRRAFASYPMQILPQMRIALAEQTPKSVGIWEDDDRVGGLQWVALPGNAVESAVTCATCHATVENGSLIAGKNAADLQFGRITSLAFGGGASSAWGSGRVDVTADEVDNPVAIPDLRPIRFQHNLHRAATLTNNLPSLAVRIETLIITSLHETVRPPRTVALGLAMYLMSLGENANVPARDHRGAAIFEQTCARCHQGAERSGPPVALEIVGTDRAVGESPERTTGMYRVPSLRFVGDRRRLFAAGQADDLADVLSPTRKAAGHRFGFDLSEEDRAALTEFVRLF